MERPNLLNKVRPSGVIQHEMERSATGQLLRKRMADFTDRPVGRGVKRDPSAFRIAEEGGHTALQNGAHPFAGPGIVAGDNFSNIAGIEIADDKAADQDVPVWSCLLYTSDAADE